MAQIAPDFVVHNCERFFVVNKPPDVRIDGPDEVTADKLAEKALADIHSTSDPSSPAPVLKRCHQLDYATSGLLIYAKSRRFANDISKEFRRRRVKKVYLAVVFGHVDPSIEHALLDWPLASAPAPEESSSTPKGDSSQSSAPAPKGDSSPSSAPAPKEDSSQASAPAPKGDSIQDSTPAPKGDSSQPSAPASGGGASQPPVSAVSAEDSTSSSTKPSDDASSTKPSGDATSTKPSDDASSTKTSVDGTSTKPSGDDTSTSSDRHPFLQVVGTPENPGRNAVTEVHILERGYLASDGKTKATKVRLHLVTGRRHQLRVHLARFGHPIVGDYTYAKDSVSERMMLHAWKLFLPLPKTPLLLTTVDPFANTLKGDESRTVVTPTSEDVPPLPVFPPFLRFPASVDAYLEEKKNSKEVASTSPGKDGPIRFGAMFLLSKINGKLSILMTRTPKRGPADRGHWWTSLIGAEGSNGSILPLDGDLCATVPRVLLETAPFIIAHCAERSDGPSSSEQKSSATSTPAKGAAGWPTSPTRRPASSNRALSWSHSQFQETPFKTKSDPSPPLPSTPEAAADALPRPPKSSGGSDSPSASAAATARPNVRPPAPRSSSAKAAGSSRPNVLPPAPPSSAYSALSFSPPKSSKDTPSSAKRLSISAKKSPFSSRRSSLSAKRSSLVAMTTGSVLEEAPASTLRRLSNTYRMFEQPRHERRQSMSEDYFSGQLAHECALCANFSLETEEGERRRKFDALVFGRQLRHASRGAGVISLKSQAIYCLSTANSTLSTCTWIRSASKRFRWLSLDRIASICADSMAQGAVSSATAENLFHDVSTAPLDPIMVQVLGDPKAVPFLSALHEHAAKLSSKESLRLTCTDAGYNATNTLEITPTENARMS